MDKMHFESESIAPLILIVTVSSASTQTWMSVLKMFLVIGVCAGQVYFITQFFSSKSSKSGGSKNMNPFGRNVI